MEGVPPSLMEDDVNQLDFDTFNMSEFLLSPPEEVPVNQSSISCNDQAGQNLLVNINDTIQQTTRFPPSFPQTMMDGAPPSFVDDNVSFTSNELDIDTLMSELPPSFPQTMITIGGLDGTSTSWINQNGSNWSQTPSSSRQFPYQFNQVPITPNPYGPQCSAMLPEPSQTLRSPQFPPHNLQVSGDHNQGQVDQASVIPHIDNMQQENLVPLNFRKSTRSQMENLQLHVLQNQNARPNASNAGPHSSLQSQNTQQVRSLTELSPIANCLLQLLQSLTYWMEGVPPSFMEDYVNQLEGVPSLPLEEVPVNQSSISCNDQAGQNMLVDNNDSTQQTTKFPPHNHQVSVIPHIDNMQQENSMPRNFGKSTRSQMENLQVVHVLQNQTARPNASNPGPDSSLQSQNRGLNTQQVRTLTELSSSFYAL
ncbi:hypothetical protein OIU85_003764 [Salix viminalis]|uniref:Uncharacterized protein n=1 Tax=Salix viminalis TaxID=40686 RepID=A0A9Q0Q0E2_SALVM|nr:hypothetical protein OIU85_003764 [Salix viminalis]